MWEQDKVGVKLVSVNKRPSSVLSSVQSTSPLQTPATDNHRNSVRFESCQVQKLMQKVTNLIGILWQNFGVTIIFFCHLQKKKNVSSQNLTSSKCCLFSRFLCNCFVQLIHKFQVIHRSSSLVVITGNVLLNSFPSSDFEQAAKVYLGSWVLNTQAQLFSLLSFLQKV